MIQPPRNAPPADPRVARALDAVAPQHRATFINPEARGPGVVRVPALNVGTGKRPVYRLSRQEILACLKPPTTRPPSPASESPVESSAGSCDPTSGSPPPANDGGGSSSPDRDARPSASPRPRRLVVREASR